MSTTLWEDTDEIETAFRSSSITEAVVSPQPILPQSINDFDPFGSPVTPPLPIAVVKNPFDALIAAAEADADAEEARPLTIHEGWDESNQAFYYFDESTETSSWVKPLVGTYIPYDDCEFEGDEYEVEEAAIEEVSPPPPPQSPTTTITSPKIIQASNENLLTEVTSCGPAEAHDALRKSRGDVDAAVFGILEKRNDAAVVENIIIEEEHPAEFECPITMEIMDDPVICMDGHTYERAAITEWIGQQKGNSLSDVVRSPKTNEILGNEMLVPNFAVRGMIVDWKEKKMKKRLNT